MDEVNKRVTWQKLGSKQPPGGMDTLSVIVRHNPRTEAGIWSLCPRPPPPSLIRVALADFYIP